MRDPVRASGTQEWQPRVPSSISDEARLRLHMLILEGNFCSCRLLPVLALLAVILRGDSHYRVSTRVEKTLCHRRSFSLQSVSVRGGFFLNAGQLPANCILSLG